VTFQPVIPTGGFAGWRILKATMPTQRESFDQAPRLQRDTAYFEANIGSVTKAEDLVADRRLLRVALGAFGLGDDLNNRAFLRKILEDGSVESDALANRLTDSRYLAFAKEFGFGDPTGVRTGDPGFAERITGQFHAREFEIAVGNQDQALRLALNAERALPETVATGSERTKWLRIMGDPPLREVFETALGVPRGFGQAPLDRQVEEFSDRAQRQLGLENLSELEDPANMEKLVKLFILRDQVAGFATQTPGSAALTLLQNMRPLRA